nr:unnamed protein product [Digitaria exilis]
MRRTTCVRNQRWEKEQQQSRGRGHRGRRSGECRRRKWKRITGDERTTRGAVSLLPHGQKRRWQAAGRIDWRTEPSTVVEIRGSLSDGLA